MKKLLIYSLFGLITFVFHACLETDNYAAPSETVYGKIVDKNRKPVYANAGQSSVRIKMLDYGYSETPSEYYLNVHLDGTYINEKIFKSTYTMIPQGPFVPVTGQEDVYIKGKTNVDFVVEPFFVVEWGEPALTPNADGTVTAKVKVTRGTDNPDYQRDPDVVSILISTTQYVGTNNSDQRFSASVSGTAAAAFLNSESTITSVTSKSGDEIVKLKSGYTYYARLAVRSPMNGEVVSAYNFSDVKKIVMP